MDGTLCPTCGSADSRVKDSRQNRRRRCCRACGALWSTIETFVEGSVGSRKPRQTKKRKKPQRRTRAERIAQQRGCVVPPELEADWKTLHSAGYTAAESARTLGLPFTLPRKKLK